MCRCCGPCAIQQRVLEHQRRHRDRTGDVDAIEQVVAVDVGLEERQRLRDLARRGRRDRSLACAGERDRLVGVVLGQHDRRHPAEPAERAEDQLRRPHPAGQDDARGGGEVGRRVREHRRQQHVGAVAGRDQHGALGDPLHQVRQRHRRDGEAQRLAPQQIRVARDHLAVAGRRDLADRRRHQQVDLRDREDRDLAARDDGLEVEGLHAVGDDADDVAADAAPGRQRDRRGGTDLGRGALMPRDDEQRGQAEIQGHAGVEGQLARGSGAREVGADDQNAVALGGQRPVARDDLLQRARLVGADVLVADAARGLIRQQRAAERPQQVEQRVVPRVGDDRPEDAEALHAARQQLLDAERDRGLAGRRLAAGHVDAGRHGRERLRSGARTLRRPRPRRPGPAGARGASRRRR